ncbi:MAG: transposase family protein [Planctomycetota bacterium]|nr:transposase family protein [Planctomycetota bacterium]
MAWFVGTLVIHWHSLVGHEGSHVVQDRPWYAKKVTPTFADILGALRLQL